MVREFRGKYSFLSNFWPVRVDYEGVTYPSVEHAFQAAKTLNPEEREDIRLAGSAGNAKRLGQKVTIRPDWDNIKIAIMQDLIEKKFAYPNLKEMLLNTGDEELVEGNSWGDVFWGVYCGEGQNWLGKTLMKVRDELRLAKECEKQ